MNYQSGGTEALLDTASRAMHSGVEGSASAELEDRWFAGAASRLRDISRNRITSAILKMRQRGDDWDGYGSLAHDLQSIFQAIDAVESFIDKVSANGLNWFDPNVGLDENGHVVLEWWNGDRRFTVYFVPDLPEFLCSWGPNIESQMHAGKLTSEEFLKKWRWLSTCDA